MLNNIKFKLKNMCKLHIFFCFVQKLCHTDHLVITDFFSVCGLINKIVNNFVKKVVKSGQKCCIFLTKSL